MRGCKEQSVASNGNHHAVLRLDEAIGICLLDWVKQLIFAHETVGRSFDNYLESGKRVLEIGNTHGSAHSLIEIHE